MWGRGPWAPVRASAGEGWGEAGGRRGRGVRSSREGTRGPPVPRAAFHTLKLLPQLKKKRKKKKKKRKDLKKKQKQKEPFCKVQFSTKVQPHVCPQPVSCRCRTLWRPFPGFVYIGTLYLLTSLVIFFKKRKTKLQKKCIKKKKKKADTHTQAFYVVGRRAQTLPAWRTVTSRCWRPATCRCSVALVRSPSPPAPRPASVCERARGRDAQAQTTSSRSTCSVFVLCVRFFCTHFWSL